MQFKGQLFLKCLFGIFNSSKTNEKIWPNFYGTSSQIEDTKKSFRNQLTFSKTSPAMHERAKVGISWEMISCFLLGLTIYLVSADSGDSNGSGYSDGSEYSDGSGYSYGSGDSYGSEDSNGSGFSDGSEDSDGSGYSDGSGDSNGSGYSDGSGDLDGSEDLDSSGDSDGSGDSDISDEVGKSTKLAQFLFKIYEIGKKVFSQLN